MELIQSRIFSAQECNQIWSQVEGLFPYWRLMRPQHFKRTLPFYVLGNPAYTHRGDIKAYLEADKKIRPILLNNFRAEYKIIESFMSDKFGAKATFASHLSLPGFHIFRSSQEFKKQIGPWHVDFDFILLKWRYPVDQDSIKAFTIPICVPAAGAFFDYLNLSQLSSEVSLSRRKLLAFEKKHGFTSVRHRKGFALIQQGNYFHRIGTFSEASVDSDYRVTLQGLAVKQGKNWKMFW